MLAPEEFTVGAIGSAVPLSLILPRHHYEDAFLIGHVDGAPVAVFLAGQFRFHCFPSGGNRDRQGLIIPTVRVEVDETSLSDGDGGVPLGSAVRTDTRLIVRAKFDRFSSSTTAITLHDGLSSTGEFSACFTRWQVVIGSGDEKRVLTKIDLTMKAEA